MNVNVETGDVVGSAEASFVLQSSEFFQRFEIFYRFYKNLVTKFSEHSSRFFEFFFRILIHIGGWRG